MGLCELHPEFEKSRGNHVLNLEKAGCSGGSFPKSGRNVRGEASGQERNARKVSGMEKGERKKWRALKVG